MSTSRVPLASHRSSTRTRSTRRRRSGIFAGLASGGIATAVGLLMMAGSQPAYAAEAKVGLGTAESFAVLAGSTVTNTGATIVTGNLGVSPGTAITGFPPGQVIGTQHSANAVALQAQKDLTTAYDDAAGRTPATAVTSDLGGQTLVGGVYRAAAAMALTGTVTLDGQGDPDAVFILQAGSTLTSATGSTVALVNGAQACNVFWQVGSSATLGTNTLFNGTILALTTVTLQTNTTLNGRALARNGAVNLDDSTVTRPGCLTGPTATATTSSPTPTVTSPTATATTSSPTPTVTSPTATATTSSPTPTATATSHPTPTAPAPTAPAPTATTTTSSPTPAPPAPTAPAPTVTTSSPTPTAPAPSSPTGTDSPTAAGTRSASAAPFDPTSSEAPGGPPAASSPPDYSIPVGNPDTGRDGTGRLGDSSSGQVWLVLGLAALGGSGLAGGQMWRRTRVTSPTA